MGKRAILAVGLLLAALVALGCCSTAGYYTQATWGGAKILTARRPITGVLEDPATPPELRSRLAAALEARQFAVAELGLPDNGSYRHYVALERPYVSWVVTAAPELSLEAKRWCFPIAGCVTYRGYFSPRRAERFATRLERRGYDVDVSGVTAFSTLGWFADPVLSTFVDQPPASLAGLIFHELAHQRLYLKGDTRFNESFATLVERQGVARWLARRGEGDALEAWEEGQRRRRQLNELLIGARGRLEVLYAGTAAREVKLRQKEAIFQRLAAEIRELRLSWGVEAEETKEQLWNNADLVAVGAYWDLVPAFGTLLARQGGDLEAFYEAVERLAELDAEARAAELAELAG